MKNCYNEPSLLLIENTNLKRNIITSKLICCENDKFELYYHCDLVKNLLGNYHFFQNEIDNDLCIHAKCLKCGEIISVFDNREDGYDNFYERKSKKKKKISTCSFNCLKCNSNNYSIKVLLEYPDETFDGKINEKFTWIWIEVTCNHCGKKYKNILNIETG